MKKFLSGVLCLILILSCTGCMPSVQIDRRLLVQGIGIDWTEGEYQVTLQVFSPAAKGETEGAGSTDIHTAAGENLAECMQSVCRDTGRSLFLGNCRMVILGANAMGENREPVLDYLLSNHELRPGIPLLFTEGQAADLLKAPMDGAEVPAMRIHEVVSAHIHAGLCPDATLLTVIQGIDGPGESAALPLLDLTEDDMLVIAGTALLLPDSGYTAVAAEDWRGAAYLLGQLESADYTLGYKGGTLRVTVTPVLHLLSAQEENGRPLLQLQLRLNCAVQEFTGGRLDWNSTETAAVAAVVERQAQQELQQSFGLIQAHQADVLGLLPQMKKFTPKLYQAHSGAWLLEQAELKTEIQVNITSLGSGARAAA